MSAMVRFFVEARALDTDRRPGCSRRPTGSCAGGCPRPSFATGVPRHASTAGGCATATPATRRRGCCARTGVEELRQRAPARHRGGRPPHRAQVAFGAGDTLFAATDGLLGGAPRGRVLRRRPAARAARRARPHARPAGARRARAWRGRALGGEQPRRRRVLVVRPRARRLRREPPDSPGARALFERVHGARARAARARSSRRPEAIFASEAGSRSRRGVRSCSTTAGGRSAAAACAARARVAEIKRMFVTAERAGSGHGRRLLAELERLAAAAGARRVRLLTTEALRRGARALRVRRLPRSRGVPSSTAAATPGSSAGGQALLRFGLPPWGSMSSPVERPSPAWDIAAMNTIELRTQLLALEAERPPPGVGSRRPTRVPQRSRRRDRGLARGLHLRRGDRDRLAALRPVGPASRCPTPPPLPPSSPLPPPPPLSLPSLPIASPP